MLRRLLHRWFVEYNPLYILSAALVLRGVNQISDALASAGYGYAQLGVPAVVEIYAWLLIGGAALLRRVGLQRPAVMLSLLAVVYQGDLTLHTETCAYLGSAGLLASLIWLVSFVLKLLVLPRAMGLRASPSALAVPTFGAVGLVFVPRVVQHVSAHAGSMVTGAWIFALFACALYTTRAIASVHALGDWGNAVLRRSRIATWTLWAMLAALHVGFWFSQRALDAAVLVPLPLLLATRFMRRESHVWATSLGAIVLVRAIAPQFLAFTAVLCGVVLMIRAAQNIASHTRAAPFMVGTLFCAHLALWTAGFSGGDFPLHVLPLDATLASVVILAAWKLRVRVALAPLAALFAHHMAQARIVTAPVTGLEWGVWTTAAGFVLLLGVIATSVRLQLNPPPDPEPRETASR